MVKHKRTVEYDKSKPVEERWSQVVVITFSDDTRASFVGEAVVFPEDAKIKKIKTIHFSPPEKVKEPTILSTVEGGESQ